ncbi:MAG: GWxTD domain-containing protein [Bacteroidetes bacterium]|jgi:GWxTD domain-containing protein|nr:GWxTD domain-containing protein [Bacteroidota bacterium]
MQLWDELAGTAETSFPSFEFVRHLSALEPILPDALVDELGLENAIKDGDLRALSSEAGKKIQDWWRGNDPFPATPLNERMIEHLRRFEFAFDHFVRTDDANRLDDRGRIYMRYGRPTDAYPNFGMEKRFSGTAYWVYSRFHENADFFFLYRQGDGYVLGTPADVLSRDFGGPGLAGLGPTERGQSKAEDVMGILENVYGELAHLRSRHGIILSDLRMQSAPIPLHSYALKVVNDIEATERQAAERREETVPRQRTHVGDELRSIPIALRPIRRLNPEGETTVDVYWSAAARDLQPLDAMRRQLRSSGKQPSSSMLLAWTVIQEATNFEQQQRHEGRMLVRNRGGGDAKLPTQHLSFSLDEQTSQLAVQLDAYWTEMLKEANRVRPTAKVSSGVVRVDSLASLTANPGRLEISDLLPRTWTEGVPITEAAAYPFQAITPSTNLAVEFDIYHLTYNENDQTDYTVEYRVRRSIERSGLGGLFRGDSESETVVETQTTSASRTSNEFVDLDLGDWKTDKPQDVTITVTVTDNVSRQTATRSLEFRMLPPR